MAINIRRRGDSLSSPHRLLCNLNRERLDSPSGVGYWPADNVVEFPRERWRTIHKSEARHWEKVTREKPERIVTILNEARFIFHVFHSNLNDQTKLYLVSRREKIPPLILGYYHFILRAFLLFPRLIDIPCAASARNEIPCDSIQRNLSIPHLSKNLMKPPAKVE